MCKTSQDCNYQGECSKNYFYEVDVKMCSCKQDYVGQNCQILKDDFAFFNNLTAEYITNLRLNFN
jgi:hypothetical protein